MFTAVILVCSLVNADPRGCGPNNAQDRIVVGPAISEGDCVVKGHAEMIKHPDTAEVYYKLICVVQ